MNGLRAVIRKGFFGKFLEECNPDVLCLQETKISRDLVSSMDLPFKYSCFSCADKKGYSGTAILSNVEPLSMSSFLPDGHAEEGRLCLSDFGSFRLVDVYVPNSQSELQRLSYREKCWDSDFRSWLSSLPKPLLVCGDMNVAHEEIDLARPDDNHFSAGFTDQERRSFSETLRSVPLSDVWRERNKDKVKYSWWSYRGGARSRNVGWRIDYFLSSPELLPSIKDCEIHDDIEGSDHCPVSVEI